MSRPGKAKDPSTPPWQPPTAFEEYRVMSPLSRGGMGEVYLGYDTLLDRSVAIKFIGAGTPDVDAREQFLTEARAAARLQHPNVVSVYRVGEWGDRPYIISEYVRGRSLSSLPTPMRWQRTLELGIGLARGLAAAHRSGVLHRDIKPSNAIISDTEEVKLLDFGLATFVDLRESLPTPPPQWRKPPLEPTLATGATQKLSSDESIKKVEFDPTPPAGSEPPRAPAVAEVHPPRSATSWPSDPKQHPPMVTPRIVGTPYYMAPEIWNGEPSTRQSDIYAMGALLFELLAGSPPHYDPLAGLEELRDAANHNDAPPLNDLVPDIEPRLAEIVGRCLRRRASERYASGDELREALEALREDSYKLVVPEGNPYRGLCAFEAEHRSLFFGRSNEIGTVLERLRTEAFLLIAADSGIGKSSLCRAGILPLLSEGALGAGRQWKVLSMVPGRTPLAALCEALAPLLRISELELQTRLREDPTCLPRELHRRLGDEYGVVLFVDQLEEIVTIADPAEAALVGQALGRLAHRTPFARLLGTARSDFLSRISTVPSLGDELSRALYFLRPMYPEKIRQAIVGPARKKSVRFESEALVDTLVDETAKTDGGLPLLQFALTELWDARTGEIITQKSLESIGGVTGALARHADQVIVSLPAEQRGAARRILMRLVTIEGTRARRTEEELGRGEAAHKALSALTRGRMIVAHATSEGTVYEVAHEALLKGWSTLRRWLEEHHESRAVKQRLETAATEWQRLGRDKEALWSTQQLAELRHLDAEELLPRELEFIAASQKARRRGRLFRNAGIVAVPLTLALFYGGMQLKDSRDRSKKVTEHLSRGRALFEAAQHKEAQLSQLRRSAFVAFDTRKKDQGEKLWAQAEKLASQVEDLWSRASRSLEAALTVDPSREDASALFAESLYESALSAERAHKLSRRNDLVQRMLLYDARGVLKQRWDAPAELRIESRPPGAKLKLQRYVLDERQNRVLAAPLNLGPTPRDGVTASEGSYLLTLALPGRDSVRFPLRLSRGEQLRLDIELPRHDDIPEGFVYIPAGRFLFGTASEDSVRQGFLSTVPIHEQQTEAYLISRFEITYGDYIEYLNALPPAERKERSISVPKGGIGGGVELKETADKQWQLTLQPSTQVYTVRAGEEIRYAGRKLRKEQDWLRLPISAIGPDDVYAYARWLDASGHVPGARLCTELQWERAARGADEREFPHGDSLDPSEANFDETYGKNAVSAGPDGIGSYPATTTPFGLFDMAGNVFEWAESSLAADEYVVRGGSYFQGAIAARTTNRSAVDKSFRDPAFGARICAPYKPKR